MIPKKIHYCWFGRGEKPKLAQKCIESWKKHFPDYEIIEWNEDNFDVNVNPYTKKALETKKYAFLSDWVRLKIIYEEGGIYFDTDVEVLRPFDALVEYGAFLGFENSQYINTGLGFGACAGNELVKCMLNEYDALLSGDEEFIGCPILNSIAAEKFGFKMNGERQIINGMVLLPADYFNPYDDPTGRLNKTSNTYSIHWYAKSWVNKGTLIRSKLMKPIHRLFGVGFFRKKKK